MKEPPIVQKSRWIICMSIAIGAVMQADDNSSEMTPAMRLFIGDPPTLPGYPRIAGDSTA